LRSASDQRRTRAVLGALLSIGICAAVFHVVQNRFLPVGGSIAVVKLAWLTLAIVFWLVLPAFLMRDDRALAPLRQAFGAFFLFMAARAAVEGWMLYVTLNWSPWYGIGHDLACIALLAIGGWRALGADACATPLGRLLGVHLVVTALMFVPEIGFAYYMTLHFDTAGADAVYFVPDDARHQTVLRATGAVVGVVAVYAPVFLWRWLGGTADGARAPSR